MASKLRKIARICVAAESLYPRFAEPVVSRSSRSDIPPRCGAARRLERNRSALPEPPARLAVQRSVWKLPRS